MVKTEELGDFMNKKTVTNLLMLVALSYGISPAFALKLDKPPVAPQKTKISKNLKVSKNKKKQKKVSKVQNNVSSAPASTLYPAKYTREYIDGIKGEYNAVSRDEVIYVALDMLKGTGGEFSRDAILGNNLTDKPVKVEFKKLSDFNKKYTDYDALGWKRGSRLYIYINDKHNNSPAIALAALLSHEALHQDEYNSLAEETYAWTMEAAVWTELVGLYPSYDAGSDSLVVRENTLKKIFERGNYTDKYIKKTVYSNDGYQNLPESSPGFEAL